MNLDVDIDNTDGEKLLTLNFVIYNIMSLDRLSDIRITDEAFVYKPRRQCDDQWPKLLCSVKDVIDFVLLMWSEVRTIFSENTAFIFIAPVSFSWGFHSQQRNEEK